MASSASYKKLFISSVLKKTSDYATVLDGPARTVMKAHIMGAVTGIKRFPQRTVFVVDDGTGALDCILWHKEYVSRDISQLQRDIRFGNSPLTSDMITCALSLLKNAEMSEVDDDQYVHGDILSCLGNVKVFRGKPQLEIRHHYKSANVDSETLWILDVLATNQNN